MSSFCDLIRLLLYEGSLECNDTILLMLELLPRVLNHRFHSFFLWERRFSKCTCMGDGLRLNPIGSTPLLTHIWTHHIWFGMVLYDQAWSRPVLLWSVFSILQTPVDNLLSIQIFCLSLEDHWGVWQFRRSDGWIFGKSFQIQGIPGFVLLWPGLATQKFLSVFPPKVPTPCSK